MQASPSDTALDSSHDDSSSLSSRIYEDIYILYPDGRKYGPGSLSFTETTALWAQSVNMGTEPRLGGATAMQPTPNDTRYHRWETSLEDVNLQAMGSDGLSEEDGTAGYVIVQVGEDYDEVRLIHRTNNETVRTIFQTFCQGVAQCPAPTTDGEDAEQAFAGFDEDSGVTGDDNAWFPREDFGDAQQTHERLLAMMTNSLSEAQQGGGNSEPGQEVEEDDDEEDDEQVVNENNIDSSIVSNDEKTEHRLNGNV